MPAEKLQPITNCLNCAHPPVYMNFVGAWCILVSEPRISPTPRTSSGTSGSPFKLLCKCSELARPCGYREVEVLSQDASHFRFMVENRSLRIDNYLGRQRSPGSAKRIEVAASRIRPSHAVSASTCSS